MKTFLNEGNQIHNFISSSGSGTVINYGSGSDFLTNYGSGSTTLLPYLTYLTYLTYIPYLPNLFKIPGIGSEFVIQCMDPRIRPKMS
jgi:hypothetical protein